MQENSTLQGGCACGSVRYEVIGKPLSVHACHCTDCQTLSASAFRVVARAAERDFRLLSGTPKTYVKTTADSGHPRAQVFCGDCGTALYATSPDGPDRIFGLRVGALRERDQLTPRRQFWSRSKLSWLPELPGLALDRQS